MPKIKRKSAFQKAHDVANRRLSENFEQQSQRLLQNRERAAALRNAETLSERSARQSRDRNRQRNIGLRQSAPEKIRQQTRNRVAMAEARRVQTSPIDSQPIDSTNFENYQKSLAWDYCIECKEKFIGLKVRENICLRCQKFCNRLNVFTAANNMDPGDLPDALKNLSMIEEQLIARVHPVISVFKIKGQQYGYNGQVINFPQNVQDIARHLPRKLDTLSSVVVFQKKTPTGYSDFRVNRKRVEDALKYLCEHNMYYKDVIIDEEQLSLLPENGHFEVENMINTEKEEEAEQEEAEEEEEEKEEAADNVASSDAPFLGQQDLNQQLDETLGIDAQPLQWPKIEHDPINEFTTAGYIAMAFPTLFPTGAADLRAPRLIKVSPVQYFQHLMHFHDQRFARNPRFRFLAMNSLMRWSALKNGTICIQHNSELKGMSIEEIKKQIMENKALRSKLLCFNSTLRGSSAYWRARCSELLEMVQALGAPTLFFTLSAADIHWPELYRLLDPNTDYSSMTSKASYRRRSSILNENPLVVSFFFHKRADYFIKNTICPQLNVKDMWYRTEFQHRGSPHIHGVLWLADAPDVSKLNEMSEDELSNVLLYFDNLISTMNPQMNAPAPVIHPCQLHYSDVQDHEEDYINILNCCQRHTKHGPQCIRKNKKTKREECRFKFPFTLQPNSKIIKEDENWQMITARNDPLLNRHNRFICEHWRANTDIQCILSTSQVLNYIAKYASKAEPRSQAFEDLLTEALTSNKNETVTMIVQKVFLKMCCERDFSAQETFHILMGWPLYHCSRAFVKVNVEEKQWLPIQSEDADELDNVSAFEKSSVLDIYPLRPDFLENMPIIDVFSKYYKKGQNWIKRRNPAVVRVFPKRRLSSGDDTLFFRQQVILNVPWRSLEEFKDKMWQTWYQEKVNEIQDELVLPTEVEDEYEGPESQEDKDIEEWMIVAGAGPSIEDLPSVELGTRDVDLSFNWGESYHQYANPLALTSFIADKKGDGLLAQDDFVEMPQIEFSNEQLAVLNLLRSQVECVKGNQPIDLIPQSTLIQGKAGSGKSTIISAMCAVLTAELGRDSFLLMAPTGAAAVNVKGSTIHSALHINVGKVMKSMGAEGLTQFQSDLQHCCFIIIDEMSMVGCSLLKKIDLRCREAKPQSCEKPFGGMFLYLLGDIKQLPPVLDRPFYGTGFRGDLYDEGQILYQSIPNCIILSCSYRQQGNDQQLFRDVLDRLSTGENTVEDWRYLLTREKSIVPSKEKDEFKEALRVFPFNKDVAEYNCHKLTSLNKPTVRIEAINNCAEAKRSNTDLAHGLEQVIYLAVGCRVMLTTNLWTAAGLVNGALGTVVDIVFEPGLSPPADMPLVVCVKFDKYLGPTIHNNSVPISPIARAWNSNNTSCSRVQFPLTLAWAVTIHKSQGLTLNKIVIDIGDKELAPGCTYVAFSRAKRIQDILIAKPFDYERLQRIKAMRLLNLRLEEEKRLCALQKEFTN